MLSFSIVFVQITGNGKDKSVDERILFRQALKCWCFLQNWRILTCR